MRYLITFSDLKENTREVSQNLTDIKVKSYIEESENIDIKSALGDALFLDLKEHTENYELLMNGGTYESKCGEKRVFVGVKKALCYYVLARLMKNGDYNVTRFGLVQKQTEYSQPTDYKEKVTAYSDVFVVADRYLKECVKYLDDCRGQYPIYQGKGKIKSNRIVYRILGE